MKVLVTMRAALENEQVLGHAMPDKSWSAWRALLIAAAGERLTKAERKDFRRLTGRDREPGHMCELLLAVAGRRSGKSKAASVFAVWLATCCDWQDVLSLGERGYVLIVSPTERQSTVISDYVRGIIGNVPMLSELVEDQTQATLRLQRSVGIEIMAANGRTVRGITSIGVILDESAFLPSNEDSALSDVSLLEAVRPSVATTQAPILLTSSPATTVGIVHTLFQKHHGPNGSPDTIVIQADTRSLNPTIRQSVIDKAFADDAASAASEYGGMFRSPMGAFLSRELVESCVEKGVTERVPMPGIEYKAFVDVASGSGSDAFAAAVGHRVRDGNRNIVWLDQVFVKKPPFDPLSAIGELCSHLQRWRITQISGDAYAGGFTPSAFGNHGIAYIPAKLNASELYLASLPAFTSGTVKLLDLAELVEQLVNLRRKVGQAGAEQVLHQRGHHDDIANAVAGLVHLLSPIEPIAVNSGIYDWIGVISEPRAYAGSYSSAEDAAHAYLTKGSYRSNGGWP